MNGTRGQCGVPTTQRGFPLKRLWLLGCPAWCADAIQGKEGGIQVLVGLGTSSQAVRYNIRVIHEQAKRSSWMIEVNIAQVVEATLQVAPNSGVQNVPIAHLPEQLQKGCWQIWKALEILPTRQHDPEDLIINLSNYNMLFLSGQIKVIHCL